MKSFLKILAVFLVFGILLSMPLSASAAENTQAVSAYYGIDRDNGLIGQIAPGTDESMLLSRVLLPGEASISGGVKTGATLSVSTNGTQTDSLTLVVQADCNGDGDFSVTDMLMVKSMLLGQTNFSAAQSQAADINADGSVTITDFLQMKSNILGQVNFSIHQVNNAQQHPCILMAPGETQSYGNPEDAVTVEGSAVTWAAGTITAAEVGTARLTRGEETLLVTVCSEAPTIAFTSGSIALNPGVTAKLETVTNHPVKQSITYAVADPAVATVDANGMITAVAQGTTEITASLPNGSTAKQTVNVLPLISQITLSETSMKVKCGSSKQLTAAVAPTDSQESLIWTTSDSSIATVDSNGLVTGHANGTVTITCTSQYGKVQASCNVKVCNLIQVAITFDDGPSLAYTGKVLDMLEKYDIKATFFMVGKYITGAKDIVARMAQNGHELGYHTWSHSYFPQMSVAEIKSNFQTFQDTLIAACGRGVTVYRAPGGAITDHALNAIPHPHIYWSVDTRDWETRNTERVKNAILGGLKDGAIILLHDIHATTYTGTLAALETIFANDMDVEFLTVTEILSRNGEAPQPGITYYHG